MRMACVRRLLLLLIGLTVLTPTVYLQQGKLKPVRQPRRLYRVTTRDELSGEQRFGFIDKTGKLVIGFGRLPRTTAEVFEFSEGRAVIYLKKDERGRSTGDTKYVAGYIDETGELIIAPRFDEASPFSEGLAFVEGEGFRGLIDRHGRTVARVDGYVEDFHEGLAVGKPEGSSLWGYIDHSGRFAIKAQYVFVDDFSEGLAGVVVNGKYGFVNKNGEMVIQPRFELQRGGNHGQLIISSGRFSEGLACVRVGELYGYINHKGDFVIQPQFLHAQGFSEGLAWVVTRDETTRIANKAGWINKSGQWVVTGVQGRSLSPGLREFFSYTNQLLDWRYSEGLVPFIISSGLKTLRGYMNQRGEVVVKPGEFNEAGPFVGGLAKVSFYVDGETGSGYGYIDRKGQFIWRSK
jgi:hypothetical protein